MPPPVEVAASPDAAATLGLATRVIRKLPPPREASESASFPRRALTEIRRAFRRDRGGLWLAASDGKELQLVAFDGSEIPTSLALSASAQRGDVRGAEFLEPASWDALARAGIVESHPLVLPGRLIGLLGVGVRRATANFEAPDSTDLEIVASYLAGLLGGDLLTRRIKETDFELRYRLWELESLYDIGLSIAGTLNVDTLAEELLLRGLSLLGARRGSLDLSLGTEGELFHLDFGGEFLTGVPLDLIAAGNPILHDPAAPDESGSCLPIEVGVPFLAVPVRTEQRVLGVLAVAEKESRGGGVRPFDSNDLRTLTLLAAQAAIALENARLHREAIEKERIESEIEVAAQIQREILPSSVPQVAGLAVFGRSRPTRAVGGDYFDYLPLPGGRLATVLADVSGKGIPASLLVSTLATGIHLVVDEPFDPLESVARIDRLLLRYAGTRKFVTLALAVLEPQANRLLYVSAGHNPAILLRASGQVEQLPSTGIPLGMFAGQTRTLLETPFEPGDRLCIYSDGITEAANAAGDEFGLPALVDILRQHPNEPEEALAERIFAEVERFARGVAQYDDQTLVLATRLAT